MNEHSKQTQNPTDEFYNNLLKYISEYNSLMDQISFALDYYTKRNAELEQFYNVCIVIWWLIGIEPSSLDWWKKQRLHVSFLPRNTELYIVNTFFFFFFIYFEFCWKCANWTKEEDRENEIMSIGRIEEKNKVF